MLLIFTRLQGNVGLDLGRVHVCFVAPLLFGNPHNFTFEINDVEITLQQVRALTNKGRALEILLKNIAQEKKQMEQRYVSMLANRDTEIQEMDDRILHLDETISDLRGQLRWNPDQKEMYYRRR